MYLARYITIKSSLTSACHAIVSLII